MRYSLILFCWIAIWVTGCDRSPVVQSEPPMPPSTLPSNILKVAVYRDGKVEIDGAAMSIEDAAQRIGAAASSVTSVYYYREAGGEEPHPNASKIIAAVAGSKLPISLSSEPDFSTYVDENGTIKQRLPFLSYQWSGGHSPYRKVIVEIQHTGDAEVRIEKKGTPAVPYQTNLSKEEMGALNKLIASTQFFSQKDQSTTLVEDTGETEITIAGSPETRTLRFRHLPELDPLSHFAWRLVAQADALASIRANGDIYTAVGAVNPRHAGTKALQPDRFQEPLSSFVRMTDDSQKMNWALESLAWITTPEWFADLIATEIGDPKRRDLMLLAMPGSGSLPEPHWKALCPLYLDFVGKSHSRLKDLTPAESAAYEGFLYSLGLARYEPSIPLFMRWFEERDQHGLTSDIIPLGKMGLPGLRALIPCLDSPEEIHRRNAIELLTIASRGNPKSQYANPYLPSEYARMIPLFQKTILPKLSAILETDSSAIVRKSAADAIPEIRREIDK